MSPSSASSLLDADAAAVAALLAERSADAPFAYLVTPNADHFVRLSRMPGLAGLYAAAEWRSLNSQALAHAARWLGLRAPRVATGADILAILLDRHLCPDDRMTVIGLCPEGVAALRCRLPQIHLAHHRPPPGLAGNAAAFAEALAFAVDHPARFTLLALGSPAQERLAAAIRHYGGMTGTGLCIGAALDFWTGVSPRAPVWMRRAGLEWLFRFWREPRRLWRRYLVDDWLVLRFLLQVRKGERGAGDRR